MASGRTGALLSCAAAIGAALGGAPPGVVARLSRMGRHLGLAFQATDDLLGIWGDPRITGRPPHSDLRRRRKTLPVVAALAVETPAARRLAELLSTGLTDEDSLHLAAALVDESGGRTFTSEYADHQMALARRAIADLPLGPAIARELLALSAFLAHRHH
jgi:geranylgeranyl diphosphate synthase type I